MNCHRISNLLSAYIDGELTGMEMLDIRRHIDQCPTCREELEQVRAVKRMVGRLKTAEPRPDFAAGICASLDPIQPYSFLRVWAEMWQSAFHRLSPTVAAVSLVVLGMIVFTAGKVDEKLTAQNRPPVIETGSVLVSLPGGPAAVQPESERLRALFGTRAPRARPVGWIVPASSSQPMEPTPGMLIPR